MKNIFILFVFATALFGCDKDDDPQPINPVDQLPPATQTGENTFGCLLDGKVFTPGNRPNPLDCYYQFVDGGYYFVLRSNRDINNKLITIGCSIQKLEISENQTYQLKEKLDGNAFGFYFSAFDFYETDNIYKGEMHITKLDMNAQIVSGTFWFNIIDNQGMIHEIRNGRFDVQFTK